MYLKYYLPAAASGVTATQFLDDIKKFMDGTYTTVGQFQYSHPTKTSVIAGTAPTSGMYNTFDQTVANKLSFLKNYYDNVTGTLEAAKKTTIDFVTRFNIHSYDKNGANSAQYSYWNNFSSVTNDWTTFGDGECHILVNDTTFVFQIFQNTGSTNSDRAYTYIIQDFKKNATIDNQNYAGTNAYYPGLEFRFVQDGKVYNTEYASTHNVGIHYKQFMRADGSTYSNSASPLNGTSNPVFFDTSVTVGHATVYPFFRNYIQKYPTTTGPEPVLLPVITLLQGFNHGRNSSATNRANINARELAELPNMWRTSCGLGVTGDLVTYQGANYRLFRLHGSGSTGTAENSGHSYAACYLFPENGN